MIQHGRVVVKLAGRDAGRVGVIIALREDGRVLVDGMVRRRFVNPAHLEPLDIVIDIPENASHEDVIKALREAGFEVFERERAPK